MTGSPEAWVREALELQRRDLVPEAIAAYQRVLARWPGLAECWYNLAVLQRRALRLDDALSSYQRALDAGVSRPEEVHLNRSVIYTDHLRQHAAAERELQLALSLNPAYTPALLNLGNLYEDLGRREAAAQIYAAILARDPRCYEALARCANVVVGAPDPQLLARLRAALAMPTASAAERASLGFALGRLLDAGGDYAAAFAAYCAANDASRAAAAPSGVRYDRDRHHAFIDRIIATGTPPATARVTPEARPRPIFICGMFRSGSTLAEQLIARCPGVVAGGELDVIPRLVTGELKPYPESLATLTGGRLETIAAHYRSALRHVAPDATYVIDKRPDNFLYLGLVKRLFPNARIVHTTRDPLDNCLSVFFLHLDQRMSYALDLLDTGHYYVEYRRLMAHWRTQFGADIFDLDYDALVRDPAPVLERLGAFLGLDWGARAPEPAATDRAVKTASVWQVREPLYRRSSGRARHYAEQLRPLASYLAAALPPQSAG